MKLTSIFTGSTFSVLVCTIVTIVLSGCVTAEQKLLDKGLQPLSVAEYKELFSTKRMAEFYNTKKGRSGLVTFMPDGSQSAVSGGKTFTGTYSFKNNQYCSKMDHRNGLVKCTSWFKVSDNEYHLFLSDGSMDGKVTFK